MDASESKSLPENAYRPLAPGEVYLPVVPASASLPQATTRSILWGLFLCAIFTAAAAYSGLKVGQVMEAAIPISILAIGLARVYRRRSSLLENVIITGVGGVSGAVVAGAIFTLPALYMLKLDPRPWQTIFLCLAGGCFGVLFIIPLRRYFVRDMHGQFPFPEATAITEVLVTGEKGGSQAKLLLEATGVAAIYDFFVTTFQVWKEFLDFQFVPVVHALGEKARMVLRFDAVGFILGLGYVIGLRPTMWLCAGGLFSNLVLVPLIWFFGQQTPDTVFYPAAVPIGQMAAGQIMVKYIRLVGVGAIATAGIFGILKSLKIVMGSFSIAAKAFRHGEGEGLERTDRDVAIMQILIGAVVTALAVAVFLGNLGVTAVVVLIGLLLTLVFSFFFTSVAANAIATVARNPVSGMTMLTIIISSVVLLEFGVSGRTGMFFVMAIAGMVCTALSVAGQTITDLKTGYWLGSTPAVQERVKFLGVIVSSLVVGLVIVGLAKGFQFGEAAQGDTREVLVSPQAAIMKELVERFMSRQPVSYLLFAVGAVIAVVMEMIRVPALTFALGMYLPLELNTPALVGGWISHLVTKRSERVGGASGASMRERAIIIASGLMAGGALGGVFGAGFRLFAYDEKTGEGWYRESLIRLPFYDNEMVSQLVSATGFFLLCLYLWFRSMKTETAA